MRSAVLLLLSVAVIAGGACRSGDTRTDARFSYQNVYKERYEQRGRGGFISLTLDRGESYGGSITPDGKYLFFTSNRFGNYDIFLRALDDVEIIPVIQSATNQKYPAISPDGWIFLIGGRAGG